jgi:hypothetical protein
MKVCDRARIYSSSSICLASQKKREKFQLNQQAAKWKFNLRKTLDFPPFESSPELAMEMKMERRMNYATL